jgi:hypothetical protein
VAPPSWCINYKSFDQDRLYQLCSYYPQREIYPIGPTARRCSKRSTPTPTDSHLPEQNDRCICVPQHPPATTLDLQLATASTTTRVNRLNSDIAALQTAGVAANGTTGVVHRASTPPTQTSNSQQCQRDHRQPTASIWPSVRINRKQTVPLWPSVRTTSMCKSRQCQRDHQQPTVSMWPSAHWQQTGTRLVNTGTTGVDFWIGSGSESRQCHCDHRQTTSQKIPKPEEIRLLVHWGGQNSTTDEDNGPDKEKATKGR